MNVPHIDTLKMYKAMSGAHGQAMSGAHGQAPFMTVQTGLYHYSTSHPANFHGTLQNETLDMRVYMNLESLIINHRQTDGQIAFPMPFMCSLHN